MAFAREPMPLRRRRRPHHGNSRHSRDLVQQVIRQIGNLERKVISARSPWSSDKPYSPTPRRYRRSRSCRRTASFRSSAAGPCCDRRPCRRARAIVVALGARQSIWSSPPTCPSVFCRSRRTLYFVFRVYEKIVLRIKEEGAIELLQIGPERASTSETRANRPTHRKPEKCPRGSSFSAAAWPG